MQQLKPGAFLQGGKYRIEKALGQGGFGITYQATQVGLNRKVAIKEFFMKEYCNRDEETSQVSVGSEGSKELVSKFRAKFIKEAQNIAGLSHPHIIRIHDIFEENGTAYYVMEYWDNGSLADLVRKRGKLNEMEALRYTRQIADALRYIHDRKMNHLDVKPGNILLDENRNAVLIDFGLSKRYDEEGNQTSTTPVGISHGYAPMEQYKQGGVGTFSPATDIYSLGATLYKLLTGNTPPDANDVMEDGFATFPSGVSSGMAALIEKVMQPNRNKRLQNVEEFLCNVEMLMKTNVEESEDEEGDSTVVEVVEAEAVTQPAQKPIHKTEPVRGDAPKQKFAFSRLKKKLLLGLASIVGIAVVVLTAIWWPSHLFLDLQSPGVAVDLGLSVKWADRNVGASSPSAYGAYFAWGETSQNLIYPDGISDTYELSLDDISGNSNYDAAHANWGGTWRLPTMEELEELKNECQWTWATRGGHNGYMVKGPNGKSIFLPAAGFRSGSSLITAGESGNYWSSTPVESNTEDAYNLDFNSLSSYRELCGELRYYGLCVRPVSD